MYVASGPVEIFSGNRVLGVHMGMQWNLEVTRAARPSLRLALSDAVQRGSIWGASTIMEPEKGLGSSTGKTAGATEPPHAEYAADEPLGSHR